MSSPPPTKPPRGVKQGKETSGLLMSVIRTLSASETNEQREKERAKLEKEYKKSDARLDELVAAHAQEITDVMQKFSLVGAALSAWGGSSEAATGRVAACRGLLRLRRADLRRLWADARTHHYALQMLTDIERVVVSEREAREALSSGRVLAAAGTLQAALATAQTTLSHVTALNATRQHLEAKKRELVLVIVRRLSDAVYRSERAPLSRRVSARRRTALLLAELTKSSEVTDAYLQDITPEFEASLSEEDSTFETTVMISLEALGVLEQLKEATEKFKVQIQNELLEVIDSVSRRIIEEVDIELDPECEEDGTTLEGEGVTETGRPLARLVACLGEEFRACGARNRRLLQLWRAALQKHKISDSCLHTEQHYWSAVQQVLQLLLTEYLEIESVNLFAARSSSACAEVGADLRLSDYFAKKKPPRRRTKLFKLTTPVAHSVSVAGRRHSYPLVCRADPAHLHAVLPALHGLCADIEARQPGGECSLRAFISNYVRAGESERLAAAARADIEAAVRAPAAWRERAPPPPTLLKPGSHAVIFSCAAAGWAAVAAAARAARRCGACGGHEALRAAQAALAALATACRVAHGRMSGGAGRAARWLADDDIVRFLQALPNWSAAIGTGNKPTHQELTQAYEREAEILGSSLGDGAVTKREIIADVNALADIALLCESMDWLSANIKTIPTILSTSSTGGSGLKLTDKFCSDIAAAASIFDEISHKCLLLLHLELRIQCFHYLGQEEREGSTEEEDDAGGAAQLARALLAFHEQAHGLARHRMAYVIGGLGEMMSAAVVWRWQEAGRGALAAAARLAALRHCLAALQLPHSGLHRAHAYLHLLNCSPEEIIASVREKGAQFSELEYLNAFKIIGARRGLSPADMRAQLKLLSAALGHVGVTV
ncbi:exocyst complex component 4 [Pectinophora gossypiella]|nr:exocyst complex component 4 [Pectinophora gossypiella]